VISVSAITRQFTSVVSDERRKIVGVITSSVVSWNPAHRVTYRCPWLMKNRSWLVNCSLFANKNATVTEVYLISPKKRCFLYYFIQHQTVVRQVPRLLSLQVSNFSAFYFSPR
jgi:hypothetical protein